MPANPALIDRLNTLPTDRLAEVEDFGDFIRQRDQDRGLVRAAGEQAGVAQNWFYKALIAKADSRSPSI
jgi:hypothetical protein